MATPSMGRARIPEVALDSREGVWIAADEMIVHQARDRWSVFPAGAIVNELTVDGLTVWAATDDGVVRFESGSRRFSRLGMDEGLPSVVVTAVAADDQYVWFGTNKGLVRYRKIDRTMETYTDEDGLPHRAVNDVLRIGRRVWFATRAGLAVYDPDVDGFRAYTSEDGLGGDYVEELFQVGDDLWCLTDAGLTRYQEDNRRFTTLSFADLGAEEIRVFAVDGERIWLGSEAGLTTFETTSDAVIPFPQNAALESQSIRGVEPFGDYLFIVTDKEVVQYHKTKRTFRRYNEADNVPRESGSLGSIFAGGQLTLLFADGASVYEVQRDLWIWRQLTATEQTATEGRQLSWQLWTKADTEVPVALREPMVKSRATKERYGTVSSGAGLGYQFDGGRSLDISALLDYGEVELDGIRDGEVYAEYLGTEEDVVREVQLGDKLEYRTLEDGIASPLKLAGGHTRMATEGAQPLFSATVDGGMRRGLSVRDFLSGPRQEIYTLSQRYVLPGSERVYLDGELLTGGRDYTMIYPAGQLAFLDPEMVDDLSVVEVEYEYDVMPRKGLGVISLLDLLPGDNEVGSWAQANEPTLISEETGLYAQINGAAPKYIDRGWLRSVYVDYRQGSRTIALSIHDMGNETAVANIYNYDLPPAREPIADRENMVLDIGLATSCAIKAHAGSFYIELSIDEKSDAAKQSLKLFAIQVLDRGETAGEHQIDSLREAMVAARTVFSPVSGMEIGARALQLSGIPDAKINAERRAQLHAGVDARYETAFGEGGRVTAYAEGAGSHGERVDGKDGWASLARLKLAHPYVEGTVSGRYHDRRYAPIGSGSTMFGTLRDETKISATTYPLRWLPVTTFFSRQGSVVPGQADTAMVQHALGRLQLAHPDAPTTSVQAGHSQLEDGRGEETGRLKIVGQTEYDLAQGVLKFLGMRRMMLSGLYGFSEATTHASGFFTRGDRVEVARAEAKLAPTATETGYALFRARRSRQKSREEDRLELKLWHWELNAGARSAIIPGLIPQLNQSVVFDDDRQEENEKVRSSNASLSAQLGIYPGEWHAALTPIAVDMRYSLAEEGRVENGFRTLATRTHRVDNRMSYNGMDALEVELQELYELRMAGPKDRREGERLELRNRLVYRPEQVSPITLRFDYVRERQRNNQDLMEGVPAWGLHVMYEGAVEWLMRWDREVTTKLKATYTFDDSDSLLSAAEAGEMVMLQTGSTHQVRPEIEIRYLLQREHGSFFLVQRSSVFHSLVTGPNSSRQAGLELSLGIIWTEADNLYVDAGLVYRRNFCLEGTCDVVRMIEPRLLLTAKL